MDLACGRSCTVAFWGASTSRIRALLSARPQQRVVLPRRSSRPVGAGEEVGTEEAEMLNVKAEAEEKSSRNGSTSSSPYSTGRKWTGYVEKDTAGQTNIYAVEPTVYVSESVFSSGEPGSSAEGSSNGVAVAFGLGLIAVASATSILLTVGKNAPVAPIGAVGYEGPPLSYYITKFSSQVPIEVGIADDEIPPEPEMVTKAEEVA